MNRKNCIIIAALFLIIPVKGQTVKPDVSLILKNLYDRILNTRDDAEKLRMNDSLILIISSYAASDSVFTHSFTNLRHLGQIESPDSRIKILTWNIFLREGANRYFCYLVRKGENRKENRVYVLSGQNRAENIRTDITYSVNSWYGALYYAIQTFKKDKKSYYILLGLDYGNLMISRKIIDVLYFTGDGELMLGMDCFVRRGATKLREVLEYSSDGVVSLRFSNSKLIVFDQLASFTTGHENGSEQYGAGLSFDGYALKRGSWRFVSDVNVKNKK
jgi:hypothetical protein